MENQATMSDFDSILASRGVTRRSFMKLCAGIAAAAAVPPMTTAAFVRKSRRDNDAWPRP